MSNSVLLVDDNYLARMMLGSIIAETRPDWTVSEAQNAEDALQRIDANRDGFDVIFIDVGLPGMNGLELASKIRENGVTSALAVVTANIQKPVREKAEALGAAFIEKPLNAETLVDFFSKVDKLEEKS
ncbi:MAG TPA: response regulator [Rhodospirillales bacterium]|nr:response regulator [Rhodospirillales bacterium]